MCALNKTKKGNKAFSYLFHAHLVITISAMVSAPPPEGQIFSQFSGDPFLVITGQWAMHKFHLYGSLYLALLSLSVSSFTPT